MCCQGGLEQFCNYLCAHGALLLLLLVVRKFRFWVWEFYIAELLLLLLLFD